ncbi:endonuclease/exonuclease/phosphatase family protein [Promicromonospora thailandica]|uniref:endonuclease/exonuclease/phosphatase family protein n=1 Tax=Promicromonospora thailandica TaxID=765201 RepID=UPI00360BA74E
MFGPGNPDWERRRRLLGRTLRELDADVVALQEVPVDAPDVLAELTGPEYHFAHFSHHSHDGVAGTVATRWPHRVVAELDLRLTERARSTLPWCAALLIELDTPLGKMVVTHHKPSWPLPFELERERQALLVAGFLEDHLVGRDEAHAVVLGDFDAAPDSASMRFWRGRSVVQDVSVCYQDAWEYAHPGAPGITFDLANPLVRDGELGTAVSRQIDHILVRSGLHGPTLRVADCHLVLDAPVDGVWASDHYGVVADLVAPPNQVEGRVASPAT